MNGINFFVFIHLIFMVFNKYANIYSKLFTPFYVLRRITTSFMLWIQQITSIQSWFLNRFYFITVIFIKKFPIKLYYFMFPADIKITFLCCLWADTHIHLRIQNNFLSRISSSTSSLHALLERSHFFLN